MMRHSSLGASFIALVVVLCMPPRASADKLADFKTAAGNQGCDAIPYSSQRGSCRGR